LKFKIFDPVFEETVWVFAGEPFSEAIKHARKHYNVIVEVEEGDDEADGFSFYLFCEGRYGYIWLDRLPKKADVEFVNLVSHEAGHHAFHVLKDIGDPPNAGTNEEVFLYLQGFYINAILTKLYGKKGKPKRESKV